MKNKLFAELVSRWLAQPVQFSKQHYRSWLYSADWHVFS